MGVHVTKVKVETHAETSLPLVSEYAAKVDKLAKLQSDIAKLETAIAAKNAVELKKLTALKADQAELLNTLTEELNTEYEDKDDDTKFVVKGAKSGRAVEVGKKGTSRTITDMKTVHDVMDTGVFWKTVKMNLKDLDDYLTPEEREEVIKTERTKRPVKLIAT